MSLSLMNMLSLMSSVYITHIACYWKFFLLHYIQWPYSHMNGHKLDHRLVQASYVFCVWLRLVLYCEHSHDFIWLLPVSCTILLYNCIHMEGWKPSANHGPVCTLEYFQWCREPCYVGASVLRGRCLPLIPRQDKHESLLIWSVPYGGLA
jgi:hypothetical protein